MSRIAHFIVYCLIGIFGVFSLNVSLALAHVGGEKMIVVASSFADTCNWSIQCEKQENEVYTCYEVGEAFGLPGGSLQYVPVAKYDTEATSFPRLGSSRIVSYLSEKEILYEDPPYFIYPFVRIIKIQV